ncbi:ELO family,ELO family, conserved site [Cinara cedri]|uniref:Elongation of very long chain fatty acids protein n=1 Tax=Cinara cedri TaxID=506608 RepID=A0A5E4MDT9_9HEMI|nr:ELO family,ELO family, conserved site [Cinara cedri]
MLNETNTRNYLHGIIADIQLHISNMIKEEIKYDDEIDSWLLMNKPWSICTIIAIYLLFVLKIGPTCMKNRQPMNIKLIMLIYNATQTVFNGWLVCWFLFMPGTFNYAWNYSCHSDTGPHSRYLISQLYKAMWYYFISKIADLADTVFFVLRKKQSQVTFLHVYHHVNMAFTAWFHLRFIKSEQVTFGGIINITVHMIMYSYYFLAALGPKIKKYLWWKKYLTGLQILQFVVIVLYVFGLFIFDCQYPKLFMIYLIMDVILFFHMFMIFYKKTYTAEKIKVK